MSEIKLTLEEETPVPTLTLDTQEEETPAAKPVTVEDTPLSPEEQKTVDEFAQKIDITNSTLVMQYGSGAQKKIANFSDTALENVKTKDLGEIGDELSDLIVELRGFDAEEEEKGFLGFFKKQGNKLQAMKAKYDKTSVNVDRICEALENHQIQLLRDIAMLDKLYDMNLNYHKELSMYILAGKKRASASPRYRPETGCGKSTAHGACRRRTGRQRPGQPVRQLREKAARPGADAHGFGADVPADPSAAKQRQTDGGKNPVHAGEHHSAVEKPDGAGTGCGTFRTGDEGPARRHRYDQRTVAQERRNAQDEHHRDREGIRTRYRRYGDPAPDNQSLISTLDEVIKIQDEGRQKRRAAEHGTRQDRRRTAPEAAGYPFLKPGIRPMKRRTG